MENVKMNVAMLCTYMKKTTEELAKAAGIDPYHLAAVRAGRAKMTGSDLIALSDASGIEVRSIETSAERQ